MTDQLNIFDLIREVKAGDYVETCGHELTFDDLNCRKGQLIIISKDTESREWRQVVRVVGVIWNQYEGCNRLIYSDGTRHQKLVDERYFREGRKYRVRVWDL